MRLKIVETFLSLQGEGALAGRLAFFIRMSGCNLRCKGFGVRAFGENSGKEIVGCDTLRATYTNEFENLDLSFEDILKKIQNIPKNATIIITGGEPLLWHKNEDFLKLIKYLISQNRIIQFETNGTIQIDFYKFPIYKKCIFALGVKLSFSGEKKEIRINKKALKSFFRNADCFYKFTIKDERELLEIKEILEVQDGEVWLMPLGATNLELNQNALQVATLAIKEGFNYSDRLHIRLWNDKAGV